MDFHQSSCLSRAFTAHPSTCTLMVLSTFPVSVCFPNKSLQIISIQNRELSGSSMKTFVPEWMQIAKSTNTEICAWRGPGFTPLVILSPMDYSKCTDNWSQMEQLADSKSTWAMLLLTLQALVRHSWGLKALLSKNAAVLPDLDRSCRAGHWKLQIMYNSAGWL